MGIGKSIEKAGKNILRAILKFIIRSKEISSSRIYPDDIKNILIVRQDRKIGNLILTTPLIECCNYIFSNAKIDLLVAKDLKILCKDNPFINEVFTFDHTGFIKNPFKFSKLIFNLRRKRYIVAVESSHPGGSSFLNGILTFFSGAVYRIGFSRGMGAIFSNIKVPPDETKHYYLMQQDLVNFLKGKKEVFQPTLFVNENDKNAYKNTLEKQYNLNKEKRIAGIWVGARHNKRWNIENFKTLYKELTEIDGFFPILIFGIDEEFLYNDMDNEKYITYKFTELDKLKTFISICDVFICGDTGPLHMSRALKIPTIGIFLQNNFVTYGYEDGEKNFIIKPDEPDVMLNNIKKTVIKIISGGC